jgi:peptidoglycan/LPS O-acetylase OafA/YrhL
MTPPDVPVIGRNPAIDGLRGIAVLLVVSGHLLAANSVDVPLPLAFFAQGGRGVTVFFVISGFLITTILLKERDKTGRISLAAFYARRSLRILPAFFVYLLVVVVVATLTRTVDVSATQIAAAGLFVWNYSDVGFSWWLGHSWSLAVEEQFYLLWPLLLIALRPARARIFCAMAVVLFPIVRVAQYVLFPGSREHISVTIHTRADALLIGCLLAMVIATPQFRQLLARTQRFWPLLVAYLVFVGPILTNRFAGGYQITVGWAFEQLLIALLIGIAVTGGSPALVRALSWRPLVLIGLISYSLYLWQQLFLTDLWPDPIDTPWVGVPAALAAATLSYWCVEKPFLRRKKKFERATVDFQPAI